MPESPVAVGAVIVTALVLAVGGSAWLGGTGRPRYYADLPAAAGLEEGAPVRYLGVAVGRVERLSFAAGRVRATLVLDRRDVPLRRGARVRVSPLGFLGGEAAELVPAPDPAAAPLAPGAVLPVAPPDSAALARRALGDSLVRAVVGAFTAPRDSAGAGPRAAPGGRRP